MPVPSRHTNAGDPHNQLTSSHILTREQVHYAVACLLVIASVAQAARPPALSFNYTDEQGRSMPYRLFPPVNYDSGKSYPLVLFLHGGGETGTNNTDQVDYNIDDLIAATARPEFSSFLLAPQTDYTWWINSQHELVKSILAEVETGFNVDTARRYITGLSLGGAGTWEMIIKEPHLFAAAAPIAGGPRTVRSPETLTELPIWGFLGELDSPLINEPMTEMLELIRDAGGTVRLTNFEGRAHTVWFETYADANGELFPWLFDQHRVLTLPGDVNGDGSVNVIDAGLLFAGWNGSDPDVTGDGIVDAADATILFSEWTGDSMSGAVPEPACACLVWFLSMGMAVVVANGRRRTPDAIGGENDRRRVSRCATI